LPLQRAHLKFRWFLDEWRSRFEFGIYPFSPDWPQRRIFSILNSDYYIGARTWYYLSTRQKIDSLRSKAATILNGLLSLEWQFWVIFALASGVMLVMQINVPLHYSGSDDADYLYFGRIILGLESGAIPPQWRTPGMGIFHILSGTILLDTWVIFRMLFAIFSVLIPILTYIIVRPHSKYLSLICSSIISLSMTPYYFATLAGVDHVYYFLHYLLLTLCVVYLRKETASSRSFLLWIAIIAAYTEMVRPVAAFIFWAFFAIGYFGRRDDRANLRRGAAVYIAIMVIWVAWDRNSGTNLGASVANYPAPYGLTTIAERRFVEAYYPPRGLRFAFNDAAAQGHPATKELRQLLVNEVSHNTSRLEVPTLDTPPSAFGTRVKDANAFVDSMFSEQNSLYLGFIIRTAREQLGTDRGLDLLYRVAGEHGTTGIVGFLNIFRKSPFLLFLGATPNLSGRTFFEQVYLARVKDTLMHRVYSVYAFPEQILQPGIGPNTDKIMSVIHNFLRDYPSYWDHSNDIQAQYKNDPEALYRVLMRGESSPLEGLNYQILTWWLGCAPAGSLYTASTLEFIEKYPKMLMLFYNSFLDYTLLRSLGPVTQPMDWSYPFANGPTESYTNTTAGLTPGLARELVPVMPPNKVWIASYQMLEVAWLIAPVFTILLIAALPFMRGPRTTLVCGFLLLDYLYEVASIAVFTPWGSWRYEGAFNLLPLIIASIAFGQTLSDFNRNRSKRNVLPFP
jgi:hypothetical protein